MFACKRYRKGFTLVEAMIALSITALAGSVLLLGIESTLDTSYDVLAKTQAEGLAKQLMDEIMGLRYCNVANLPYQTILGPSTWEKAGAGRERFNDTDDFNGYECLPAENIWGATLGQGDDEGGTRNPRFQVRSSYFENWKVKIDVYYVSESDPSTRLAGIQTSDFRAVDIHVYYKNPDDSLTELAHLRRVYAYVPAAK